MSAAVDVVAMVAAVASRIAHASGSDAQTAGWAVEGGFAVATDRHRMCVAPCDLPDGGHERGGERFPPWRSALRDQFARETAEPIEVGRIELLRALNATRKSLVGARRVALAEVQGRSPVAKHTRDLIRSTALLAPLYHFGLFNVDYIIAAVKAARSPTVKIHGYGRRERRSGALLARIAIVSDATDYIMGCRS